MAFPINTTQILQLGESEVIKQCHAATAVPSAVTLYIFMVAVMLISGVIIAPRAERWWKIFFSVTILGGIVLTAIIFMPFVVQGLAQFFS